MKKNVLSTLAMVMVCFHSYAQTTPHKPVKETNSPNFLVHQQLSPELIKVEYAASLSSGVFKQNDKKEASHVKTNTLTVSGYPITLIDKPEQQLYMGFGYVRDKYATDNADDALSLLDQTFQSVNLNIFLNTRIKGNFYWFSYLQAGVQGSNPFDEMRRSHNELLLNKINYKASRNMNIGVGFAYASNLGDPIIIPSVAFVYSQPHYLINIDFPVKAEVEGIIARGKWRPFAGVSFPSNTWYLKDIGQYFSSSGLTGYVGTRYRILDFLYLHAKWQTGLGETFTLGSRHEREKIGTFTGQNQIVVSINVQVARLIPIK
jgi:hypothetical protein